MTATASREARKAAFAGRELGIVIALVAVVVAAAVVRPSFVSGQGLHDLFLNASIIALLAIGQTLLVITRNIDLSVGSVMGLTAFLSGQMFIGDKETPVVLVVLAGMALGAVCGAFNGALVAIAKVPALVVTLGTLYVYRGLDYGWASATGVRQVNADQMSPDFLSFGSGSFLGI